MDDFMKECMKLANSNEFDGLVQRLAKNKRETDKHVNNFIDNLSNQTISKIQQSQTKSTCYTNNNISK